MPTESAFLATKITRANARSVLLGLAHDFGLADQTGRVTQDAGYAIDVRRHPYFDEMKAIVGKVAASSLPIGFRGIEVGAGGGNLTERLVTLKFDELVVSDLDAEGFYLDLLKRQFGSRPNIKVEARDFREVQPESEVFDAVFSCAVDHHIDFRDKLRFLRTIASVLKPSGCYISADVHVTAYNPDDDSDRLTSVTHFHAAIVQEALKRGRLGIGPATISYSAWLNELQSVDEFKVSPEQYRTLVGQAGFKLSKRDLHKVGPKDEFDHGIYVAVMRKP